MPHLVRTQNIPTRVEEPWFRLTPDPTLFKHFSLIFIFNRVSFRPFSDLKDLKTELKTSLMTSLRTGHLTDLRTGLLTDLRTDLKSDLRTGLRTDLRTDPELTKGRT